MGTPIDTIIYKGETFGKKLQQPVEFNISTTVCVICLFLKTSNTFCIHDKFPNFRTFICALEITVGKSRTSALVLISSG